MGAAPSRCPQRVSAEGLALGGGLVAAVCARGLGGAVATHRADRRGKALRGGDRYVLLGRGVARPLLLVVADDVLDDATVLVSAYEPDAEHGWTPERVEHILQGEEQPGEDT